MFAAYGALASPTNATVGDVRCVRHSHELVKLTSSEGLVTSGSGETRAMLPRCRRDTTHETLNSFGRFLLEPLPGQDGGLRRLLRVLLADQKDNSAVAGITRNRNYMLPCYRSNCSRTTYMYLAIMVPHVSDGVAVASNDSAVCVSSCACMWCGARAAVHPAHVDKVAGETSLGSHCPPGREAKPRSFI
ncbi:unnamed protein product [Arctia plantaginis]|uniref:Uncharacterized protein n=1 Tax=Arctia plantaginis TaxID=874455 RepID=A0A8S0Z279_ARCPL|nr:unnamed protein product [Arctia plantaginis]